MPRWTDPPRGARPGVEEAAEPVAVTLPPYAVILHNDDHNTTDWVVASLLRCVPEIDPERAVAIMWEAHTQGEALVLTCPLERAELYRDRLRSRGLTATVRRA